MFLTFKEKARAEALQSLEAIKEPDITPEDLEILLKIGGASRAQVIEALTKRIQVHQYIPEFILKFDTRPATYEQIGKKPRETIWSISELEELSLVNLCDMYTLEADPHVISRPQALTIKTYRALPWAYTFWEEERFDPDTKTSYGHNVIYTWWSWSRCN